MNNNFLPSKPQKTSHQLITIDNQQQILHYQKCKIIINKIAKCLIFEPEESKILSATFDKTFFQFKNFLCIFDLDSNGFNFVLILSNEKNAKKILDAVQNGKINNTKFMSHQNFINKFMLPICNGIQSNNFLKNALQKLLLKFNELFDSKQKEKFMDLCKNGNIDTNLFEEFFSKKTSKKRLISRKSNNEKESGENFDPNEIKYSSQDESYKTEDSDYEEPPSKRRKISTKKNDIEKPKMPYKRKPTSYRKFDNIYTADQILRKPDYKLVTTGDLHNPRQRLVIFSPSNKELCYEYFYSKFSKLFYCLGCHGQKHTTAYVKKINGEECIKMNSMNHICELRPFLPEKYNFDPEKQIIESPNFEILSYQQRNEAKKNLVIFDPADIKKKFCYEYYWSKKYKAYSCCGCKVKNLHVRAIVCKKSNETIYVKLSGREHICEMRVYKPEKYQSDLIYQKSDYKIIEQIKYGITSKRLFLFTSAEKTHCYIFGFNEELEKSSYYYCTRCKHRYIQAYICINSENGEEFLSVRNKKHLCEPIKYQPEKYCNNKIIKKPNYQLAKKQSRKIIMSKLLIFTSIDKNYCYEYSWRDHHNAYQCSVCEHRFKNFVIARVLNPGGTDEYIELSKNEHKCQPVKYEPRNYEIKIIEAPNFEIKTSLKNGKKVENLYIYDNENRQLSYKYYYVKDRRCWCCCGCISGKEAKRISITATIQKNENGEDFVQLGPRDHVCKPQKY